MADRSAHEGDGGVLPAPPSSPSRLVGEEAEERLAEVQEDDSYELSRGELQKDETLGDGSSTPDVQPAGENDQETKIEESNPILQALGEENCPIASPILKGIPGPELESAVILLGNKYNDLIKKHEEKMAELSIVKDNCEIQRKKCIEECEPKYEILKKKFAEERAERKRLYNEIIELKGNIRVFCRCRPLSSEEISKGCSSVVDFNPSQDTELQVICSDSSKKQFKFDHVFGPKDDQETVFAETVPVVKSVLDGYNVCIFAYGQTGTGKTFTMEGTPENRGVNYRALAELFRGAEERSSIMRYELCVSMLEVYNEKIRDLLADSTDNHSLKRLEIKQTAEGAQDIPGLIEAQVCSVDEVWEMLKTGGRNRSVGSTNANELSSRSHCLVRVTVKSDNLVDGQKLRSHMWLVDLAGSERVAKTEVEGERLKESQFINKSLSALGDCISALASKNPHIPYRNSKLTHLLQSSLGGDCKALMFAQISPSSADVGETLCSLNFASRVRGIEYGPVRKQADPAESFKIKQMAEKLRQEEKEITKLSESLQLMHLKYASRENVFKTLQEKIKESEQNCKNYQQKVRDLESQLADAKKQQSTRETTKFSKPPLAPIKERPPLGRITNRLPPSGRQRFSLASGLPTENKENVMINRTSGGDLTKPLNRARRISLAPVVRPVPTKRASIASIPDSINSAWKQSKLHESEMPHQNTGTGQLSQLRVPARRRSVAAFTFSTPRTPDRKIKSYTAASSSSKYVSPTHTKAIWKSKIPTAASPRPRLRLTSSPAGLSNLGSAQQSANKLCFSVQKRLIVSSVAQQQPRPAAFPESLMFGQALRDKELVGRFGLAQRVICKKRRQSVI